MLNTNGSIVKSLSKNNKFVSFDGVGLLGGI